MKKKIFYFISFIIVLTIKAISNESSTFNFGKENKLQLIDFFEIVFMNKKVNLSENAKKRLLETEDFINYLLDNKIKAYGLTTGFADLRAYSISSEQAGQLSKNIIQSHDAGIGDPLPKEIVLGAMVLRANSLAKGNSGFRLKSMQTLVDMINAKIIPIVPSTGSLGASGDLAFLARLGRAMEGDEVDVFYKDTITKANLALEEANIIPFEPNAKEGLALTNGTSFMASMLAIAYLKELHEFENMLASQVLFLNAINAIDAAFCDSIHQVRNQKGQLEIAKILKQYFQDSPFIDTNGIQNDYSTRCLPQIIGPKLEIILSLYDTINNELDSVTDNPLIFKGNEISSDVNKERIFYFNNEKWTILSGGNFHGECIATAADSLATANAKMALTMERQLTYLLNPARNGNHLPAYLIVNSENIGLLSGCMITQYTANALTQKICQLGIPSSIFNITSGNESEDIVSYGATSAQKLLQQLDLFHQLNIIYLTTVAQAYAINRDFYIENGIVIPNKIICEKIFKKVQKETNSINFPITDDIAFDKIYEDIDNLLNTDALRKIIEFPLQNLQK